MTVSVAPREGGLVEFLIEDDGRGIDVEAVKAAAVRARLLTAEEAAALPDEEARQLIFQSGLSTSPVITSVSGHGLGLPIVRERLDRLGGQLSLQSRPGAGTSVRMTLPASIATFHGLLVRAGGQPFLLPLQAVERALRLDLAATDEVEGRRVMRWNGDLVPVAHLAAVLGLAPAPAPPPGARVPLVVLRAGAERVALAVEAIEGAREVLVKELGAPLAGLDRVASAGLMGDGRLVLILRPQDLVRGGPELVPYSPAAEPDGRQRTILVVDDSITIRTMERNILEAAGYQVRVAVDGVDALTILKSEPCDLVVSDVDMPRLDGFALTERIRSDPQLKGLPVVLVTALESREDKERGIAVGANAYVIKSSFDQSNLLDIIRRLL